MRRRQPSLSLMNITTVLTQVANGCGDRVALQDADSQLTFSELDVTASAVAMQLAAGGVSPGMRVVILCPMSVTLYVVLIAVWRAGGVAVFVDPGAGTRRLNDCCALARPQVLIGVPRAHLLRLIVSGLRRLVAFSLDRPVPFAHRLDTCVPESHGDAFPAPQSEQDAPALITFTSGSTGTPKAIVRSHAFLLAQHRVLTAELGLRPAQRDLATLPMFVLANLASGVTSIVARGVAPPRSQRGLWRLQRSPGVPSGALSNQIRTTRPTRLAASPAFISRLLDGWPAGASLPFEHIHIGGAPVFAPLLRRLAVVSRADPIAVYGSSEAEPIATLRWSTVSAEDQRSMASGAGLLAGRIVPSIDLRILPDHRGSPHVASTAGTLDLLACPPGSPGEIVVAGDHVLSGYLDEVGNEDTKLRVDERVWHRTGDAGYLDARGRLWLLGRCSAAVRDTRGVLYPFAVECAAQELAGVERAALIAHDGARLLLIQPAGRMPCRFTSTVQRALAWAHLDRVIVVKAIPVDARHHSKIDYRALSRLALPRPGAHLC